MVFQSEVGSFFEKLGIWREESHKEFFNIIQFHSSSINKGINDLVQEVSELKSKLSTVTSERNELLETVHNLRNDIRLRNAVLPSTQPTHSNELIQTLDPLEALSPCPEVEQNDQGDMNLKESTDLNIVDDVMDDVLTTYNFHEAETSEKIRTSFKRVRSSVKGGKCCGAIGCTNSSMKRPNKHYFRVPKDTERRRKWLQNIRREDLLKKSPEYCYNNIVVCSDHFERVMFQNDLCQRLNWNAYPTLFNAPNPPRL